MSNNVEQDQLATEMLSENTIQGEVTVQSSDAVVELDVKEEPDTPPVTEETKLQFGYTVGVKEDGGFLFELHGEEKGVVQLLGLTKFAENQIDRIHDIALKQGDALLNQGLALIFQEIQVMKKAMGLSTDESQ